MKRALIRIKNELTGDVSGLRGDVSVCELTDNDRTRGIDVSDLIEET